MVPIYSLLLFGGQLSIDHEASLIKLDGWATFKAPARIAVLVRVLSFSTMSFSKMEVKHLLVPGPQLQVLAVTETFLCRSRSCAQNSSVCCSGRYKTLALI